MASESNIFRSIQLPGSKPSDSNWESAKWGFHDMQSLREYVFSDCSNELKDDAFDSLMADAVDNHESFGQRMELELFWAKVEADQKVEHHKIKHRANLAKINALDIANCLRMKNRIANHFWPIRTWPSFAVEILLSPMFNYNERLTLATFFHGNGLRNTTRAVHIIKFYNQYWKKDRLTEWKQKFYKFQKFFEYLDKSKNVYDPDYHRIGSTYYYYSMVTKHMLYYNGNKRKQGNQYEFNVNHY